METPTPATELEDYDPKQDVVPRLLDSQIEDAEQEDRTLPRHLKLELADGAPLEVLPEHAPFVDRPRSWGFFKRRIEPDRHYVRIRTERDDEYALVCDEQPQREQDNWTLPLVDGREVQIPDSNVVELEDGPALAETTVEAFERQRADRYPDERERLHEDLFERVVEQLGLSPPVED